MKRSIILALAVMLGLSFATMAGPFVGIQIVPEVDSAAALVIGWDFGNTVVEGSKVNFESWTGEWALAALWTPTYETFSYRVGPKLTLNWGETLTYDGIALVIGAAKTWGAFQLFGELNLGSSGALEVTPLIGINILFAQFFPVELVTSE